MDKTLDERIEALPDGKHVLMRDEFIDGEWTYQHVGVTTDLKALLTRSVEAEAKVAAEKESAREQFAYGIFFGRFQGNERIENLTGGDVTALFESVWDAIYAPKGESDE